MRKDARGMNFGSYAQRIISLKEFDGEAKKPKK